MEWAEQEALLESYCSTRESRLARWRYRMRVAEVAATYKEDDEAGEALFGETDDEAEDNAGSAEAPPYRQQGGGFPSLRRGTARRQRDRGHHRLHRGPAPLPTRPRHTENEEE